MKAGLIGIEAFGPYKARHKSRASWYSYQDRLFLAFCIGFAGGAGLMLLF